MKVNFLHSIYLTKENNSTLDLPERISSNIDAVRRCYPDAEHNLYNLERGRQFLTDHMTQEVLRAFDDLIPLAYKSDLLRYALLYVFGGLYSDLSVQIFYPLPAAELKTEIMIFREGYSAAPWAVSTSLIAAKSNHSLFAKCIDAIISNVATGFYGATPLCPTGPNLFGAIIAADVPLSSFSAGEAIRINRSHTHSYAYLDTNGDVVAANIKRGSGITSLGALHHDDYNEHYRNRMIYASEANAPRVWKSDTFSLNGWLKMPTTTESNEFQLMTCGPYAFLDSGTYRAIFKLETSLDIGSIGGRLDADVCQDFGQQLIPVDEKLQETRDDGYMYYSVEFKLFIPTQHVEVRLYAIQPTEFKLVSLCIGPFG